MENFFLTRKFRFLGGLFFAGILFSAAALADAPAVYSVTMINHTGEDMCTRAWINPDRVKITPPKFKDSCVPIPQGGQIKAFATQINPYQDVIATFRADPQYVSLTLPNSALNYQYTPVGCLPYTAFSQYRCDLMVDASGLDAILDIYPAD